MFDVLKDCGKWNLQLNYQKFYELCDDKEKEEMDSIINEGRYNSEVF